MPETFRFASALSTSPVLTDALAECCDGVAASLDGPPDLVLAFYSPHYGDGLDRLPQQIVERLGAGAFLGCTGESIVGGDREIESLAALSIWAARLPGVRVQPQYFEFARTPDGPMMLGLSKLLAEPWPEGAALIVLGEPYTFPADWLLERLNDERPGAPVVGGMASGGAGPGKNRVALGAKSYAAGAVGVLLSGPIDVRAIVSQGCRPLGQPFVITKAEQQMIYEFGGRPPLEYLHELFSQLSERDRELVNGGLHLGRVVNEYQESFDRGDFLIRNCLGVDGKTGALAVADYFRPGQTVQLHVRDGASADEDLRALLDRHAADFRPQGGLLFTCNGRGTRLFDVADHDAAAVRRQWPELPLAGLFAQGELGPVGGKNFLHGFTACAALFARRTSTG